MKKYKIAVLDDYQNVALQSAGGSVLRNRADITVFQNHLADALIASTGTANPSIDVAAGDHGIAVVHTGYRSEPIRPLAVRHSSGHHVRLRTPLAVAPFEIYLLGR
jgi:hypothetical protein